MRIDELENYQKRVVKLWSSKTPDNQFNLWAKPARINNNQRDILIMTGDIEDITSRKENIESGNDPEYVKVPEDKPVAHDDVRRRSFWKSQTKKY